MIPEIGSIYRAKASGVCYIVISKRIGRISGWHTYSMMHNNFCWHLEDNLTDTGLYEVVA